MSKSVIHWFQRDLRLSDNLALHAAAESSSPIIALFIFDPAILKSDRLSAARLDFLLHALNSLDESLQKLNSRLLVKRGDPQKIIPELIEQQDTKALYFNKDYSSFAIKRDSKIENSISIPVHTFDDALLLPPGTVMSNSGSPYTVYTPFKKKWNTFDKPAISTGELSSANFVSRDTVESEDIPTLKELGFAHNVPIPLAGENYAKKRLTDYIESHISDYDQLRNALPIDPFKQSRPEGSSYLSPYFRLGLLSARQAYWAAREAYQSSNSKAIKESIATWVSELTWREFYMHILYHFPHVDRGNFRTEYDQLEWENDPDRLQAWKDGLTGYPIVDAAMRQLKTIGWMPNRARMIVASFLTKDLLIHWQEGEKYFMQHLLDGDPAANNGGWQWAAGTGTDAQPYFRIFNPVSQSKKFDPDGTYIRHWVPELKNVEGRFVHAPWEMENSPNDYPAPIVDHKAARERTLAAFKAIKDD